MVLPESHVVPKAADQINLSARDIDVAALAEFIQSRTGAEILIPAANVRKQVTITLKEVTFGEAMQEVGLVLQEPADSEA
jgi:hypothetical protein